MKDNELVGGPIPISRRNVLKAGAISAVGVGLFSGTAAATNPDQINFCGCSQVCLKPIQGGGGTFYIQEMKYEDGEWHLNKPQPKYVVGQEGFCHEVTDGYKIVAVRPKVHGGFVYCNPGRCARDALAAYLDDKGYSCINDGWGPSPDIHDPERGDDAVEIVHGQCGKPGKEPNPGPNPRSSS